MPKPATTSILIQAEVREQRSGVLTYLGQKPGVTLELAPLAIGDYLLGGTPLRGVEYKQATDFVVSIMEKRHFSQLDPRAGAAGIMPLLLLEGDPARTSSRRHLNAIRGVLTYVVGILRIPILPSTGPAETAEVLFSAFMRHLIHVHTFKITGTGGVSRARSHRH